jgi:hypothetical protein
LLYGYKGGFSYSEIEEMSRQERDWYVRRLSKQLQAEIDAIKGARGGS